MKKYEIMTINEKQPAVGNCWPVFLIFESTKFGERREIPEKEK
jgi:hypothetical protein